jgi:pimeloyl-ACP methyl ester carboxylesterase
MSTVELTAGSPVPNARCDYPYQVKDGSMTATTRRVRATDGVELAVYERGPADRPTIVLVHGYPDNHTVWDGVAELLAQRLHVVAYDVRGAGASDAPATRAGYRLAQLVADLAAVADAVSPDRPVHVLAHDWGSIQSWPAVTDPEVGRRIASFTSISGPSLDHAAAWLRDFRAHAGASARQVAHSFYMLAFQLPRLPELAARRGLIDRGVRRAGGGRDRTQRDVVNGIGLYRANTLGRIGRPHPGPTQVPVQVLAPEADPFVTTRLQCEAPAPWTANLTARTIPGGHWVVRQNPDLIAELTLSFIDGLPPQDTPTARSKAARSSSK